MALQSESFYISMVKSSNLRTDSKITSCVGGGFGLSCFDGHVIFLYECAERLTAAGKDTVVAFLEYGIK